MGAHSEVLRSGGHGLAPALEFPTRGVTCMWPSPHFQIPAVTTDPLQPGGGWSPIYTEFSEQFLVCM